MKLGKISFFAALAVVVLASCSSRLEIVLFNNAGETVTVHTPDTNLSISSGQSIRFDYPSENESWRIRLSVGECTYTYAAPRTLEHYPWAHGSRNELRAQLEKDFSLILLPPGTTEVTPADKVASLQQDGFPLQPASQDCRH